MGVKCRIIDGIVLLIMGSISAFVGYLVHMATTPDYYSFAKVSPSELSPFLPASIFDSATGFHIFAGVLCLFTSFLALLKVCRKSKRLFLAHNSFSFLTLCCVMATLGLTGVTFAKVPSNVLGWLTKVLTENYEGPFNTENPYSLAFHTMMVELKCCGIKSGDDFKSAKYWDKVYVIDGIAHNSSMPYTCCKSDSGEFKTNDTAFLQLMLNYSCPYTQAESYFSKGCADELTYRMRCFCVVYLGFGVFLFILMVSQEKFKIRKNNTVAIANEIMIIGSGSNVRIPQISCQKCCRKCGDFIVRMWHSFLTW